MPFGLCNAPATFQILMEKLFQGHLGNDTLVYLDDLLMFADTEEELLRALDRNLAILSKAGLKCKPRKCQLFRSSLHYLGYIVSDKGIAPDAAKIDEIRQLPNPPTGLGLLTLVSLANYYRKLILNFADLASPLYKASQEKEIEWTSVLEQQFQKLKEACCKVPTVKIPDPDGDFILETDASNLAVGAVLKQINAEGEEVAVQWYSQALGKSEKNYSTYERELLAFVKSAEALRVFLLGKPFTLRTDHRALAAIFNSKLRTSDRVIKWIMRLQEFNFKIECIAGKDNVVADVLSRIPWACVDSEGNALSEPIEDYEFEPDEEVEFVSLPAIEVDDFEDESVPDLQPVTKVEIETEQQSDPNLILVKQWIDSGILPDEEFLSGCSKQGKIYYQSFPKYNSERIY